jgi:hypothetical protein
MTGTNCDLFSHKSSRSYLNHLVTDTQLVLSAEEFRCSLCFNESPVCTLPLHKAHPISSMCTVIPRPSRGYGVEYCALEQNRTAHASFGVGGGGKLCECWCLCPPVTPTNYIWH